MYRANINFASRSPARRRARGRAGAIRYAFSSEGYEYVIRCVFFVGGIICKVSLCVAHYSTSAYPGAATANVRHYGCEEPPDPGLNASFVVRARDRLWLSIF